MKCLENRYDTITFFGACDEGEPKYFERDHW